MPSKSPAKPKSKRAAKRAPKYRLHANSGQAIVTLRDARTGRRRDYYLGTFDSPISRERYHQLIAKWESRDRELPPTADDDPRLEQDEITVAEIIHEYWQWASETYSRAECAAILSPLRIVRQYYGSIPAASFGPKRLRVMRDQMIAGDPDADPPRKPWCRKTINRQVARVCAMFKWAASHEMVDVKIYHQLKTVTGLRRGRTAAYEPEPVQPVDIEAVEAIRPFVSAQINALITLQLHTGARGGELFQLRPIDINMNEQTGIWTITPDDHKTAHHGHRRTIYLGPKAQEAIRPFLANRPVDACLFSPLEAVEARLANRHRNRATPLSCGNTPGTNRSRRPSRPPKEHYTSSSYNRAITRACDQAFPPPSHLARGRTEGKRGQRLETEAEWKARLGDEGWAELKQWQKDHRWHPHQLRHTAATIIRREFGLEAARIALGHSSALVTDAVYAERDEARVIEVMRALG